jgi:2-polyprenyl-6-methoxyphenol hydroxylase-like FAD-dependent oxidoreductase
MTQSRAVVIGAGIGGLAAAASLHAVGWDVIVCERKPVVEAAGAGLALADFPRRLHSTSMLWRGVIPVLPAMVQVSHASTETLRLQNPRDGPDLPGRQ